MKKHLLATTALAAAGALALSAGASAQNMAKMAIKGQIEYSIGMVDMGDANDTETNDLSGIDVKSDNEIHFRPSIQLNNGLKVDGEVELEGRTESDQIDEAWVRVSGGFGQIQMGQIDPASRAMTFGYLGSISTGVGHTTLMFDVGDWLTNAGGVPLASALAHYSGDAEKFIYYTPRFSGFQLGVSYAPDSSEDDNAFGNRYGAALTDRKYPDGGLVDMIGLGANYKGKFGGIGLGAAVGYATGSVTDRVTADNKAAIATAMADGTDAPEEVGDPAAINAGLFVDMNNIRVGVGFYDKDNNTGTAGTDGYDFGVRYKFGANAARIAYHTLENDAGAEGTAGEVAFARTLGPGVTWSVSMLWASYGNGAAGTAAVESDGYALSSGIKLQF